MLHKIAQSMSCTSEAKLGRWERETHFSLTALNPAPASMIKTNPSLMNLQTYLMVSIYTYAAHTECSMQAGQGTSLTGSISEGNPLGFRKPQRCYF